MKILSQNTWELRQNWNPIASLEAWLTEELYKWSHNFVHLSSVGEQCNLKRKERKRNRVSNEELVWNEFNSWRKTAYFARVELR